MAKPKRPTQQEQQTAFSRDVVKLMNRYRAEFSLTLGSMIGCLEVVKMELMLEIIDAEDKE